MEKGKFKKTIAIAALVLSVILISITYFYVLNNNVQVFAIARLIVDIIMPFIIGAVIAYLLKGTCNFFEKRLLKLMSKSKKLDPKTKSTIANVLSIVISYIVWATAISALLAIAVSQVIASITLFIHDLQYEYIDSLVGFIMQVAGDHSFVADLIGEGNMADLAVLLEVAPEEKLNKIIEILNNNKLISESLGNFLQSEDFDATGLFSEIFSSAVNVVSTVINTVIGLVISVFLLINRKTLARKSTLFLHCLFKKEKVVNAIIDEAKFADRMFGGFLEGKVIDSTIVGLVYYIVLELIGVPYAPLVAVICGVTNIIPIFGPFIGAIPSGVIILAADYTKVIPFIIFVFVCQFIDGYIIDPHIVGGNIKLPSVWVIFAVILFGGLWGFPGLLVGVPTFAIIYDIIGKVCAYLLKKNGKYNLLVQFRKEQNDSKPQAKKKAKKKGKDNADVSDEISAEELDVIAETVAESVADIVADSIVDAVAESVAEAIAVAVAENMPETMAESIADSVTETVTEKVTDSVSEKVVEALTGAKSEHDQERKSPE